jgi:hypothetical protein
MDVRRFKELCQRLDELAAILEIMECDPINADLHREASNALSQALSEIERLRSDADQHRETSNALNQALSEIERLRSHQGTSGDGGRPACVTGLRREAQFRKGVSLPRRARLARSGGFCVVQKTFPRLI